MSDERLPIATEQQAKSRKNENDEWQKLLLALLFLLFSFSCIFCSSQTALWAINRDRIDASMRSLLIADYDTRDPLLPLAPLNEDIAAEAAADEKLLAQSQTLLSQGIPVAVLPQPIPTPTPIPTIRSLPTPLPTPTATPTSPAEGPDATPVYPPPTSPPPTSPPPTLPPPTAPPPTLPPPTSPPPTLPPPTSPPPTSPPPTSPPPTSPPPTSTPTPAPPAISISDGSISEGDIGTIGAVFTVTLSAASAQIITVDYATADGSAAAPADYTAVPTTTLTFPAGVVSQLITITVQGDTLFENDETFLVNLANPGNATLGDGQGVGTIINDDLLPTVDFESNTYLVGEGSGPAVITVTLSNMSALTVTVDYATNPGGSTATVGSDYVLTIGTLTFAPGSISQTFEVGIIDDIGGPGPREALTETVELVLSNAISATLGGVNNPATLTIVDDDSASPPCSGSIPAGVINIGPPDCMWTQIINTTVITDVTATGGPAINVDLADPDYDLVYYERMSDGAAGEVAFDQVIIEVSENGTDWYEVFNWGDGILDTNTNIGQAPPPGPYGGGSPPAPPPGNEGNNVLIPMTTPPLYQSAAGGPITGVAIDIDAPLLAAGAPVGSYRYVQITGFAETEVDSIEVP
ncbi:MAG: Calx-beta domain-containing protein [Chloroflexota bacterium]